MAIEFRKTTDFPRRTLIALLRDAYSFDPRYEDCFGQSWVEFDDFFYDNPAIADKFGFITALDGEAIGLASWDPRNRPDYVRIGHNCIITAQKGKGYGKLQLAEAVRRIKEYDGLRRIVVETNGGLVAPKNYESVGFRLMEKRENADACAFAGDYLEYELPLMPDKPKREKLFRDIETDRLLLKCIGTDDREFILKQFSTDDVNRYLYDEEPMSTLAEADELIAMFTELEPRCQHRWILVRKSDGQRLGTCGFHCWDVQSGVCELGYDMQPEYWRMGYMTEALKAIIDFGKNEMELKRIDAHIYPQNEASVRTATRQGFALSDRTVTLEFRGVKYPHSIYTLDI